MSRFKYLPLVTLLSLTTADASIYFSGLYGAIGSGASWLMGKHQYGVGGQKSQNNISTFGATLSTHLGYVKEMGVSGVMVGGEVYFFKPFSSARKDIIHPSTGRVNGTSSVKRPKSFGISGIMGTLINPKIMVYGRVGFEIATTEYNYTNVTFGTASTLKYTKDSKLLVPGLGFKYALTNSIHVGAEYNAGLFGNTDIRKDTASIDGANVSFNSKLTEQRIFLTLTYQLTAPRIANS